MTVEADAKIQQYLLLGKSARGRSLAEILVKATAEPGLFAFGELLDLPPVKELQGGEFEPYRLLLELFCYGTWQEYQEHQGHLPPLNEQQQHKLKQLTVVALATADKLLPYGALQQALAIPSVRQLEDFLITDCFYAGIVKGKLDQKQGCLQVHSVTSRDVRREALPALAAALSNWLGTAQSLLSRIEERMTGAVAAAEEVRAGREKLEAKRDAVRRAIKSDIDRQGHDGAMEDLYDLMEEDGSGLGARGAPHGAPGGGGSGAVAPLGGGGGGGLRPKRRR